MFGQPSSNTPFSSASNTTPFGGAPSAPFGSPSPAPFGGGGFGGGSTGGFGGGAGGAFGAPAPSFGGFGAPAPAPFGTSFGAPAPAPGAFGSSTTTSPFGAAPAPAGLFGAPAPAPTGGLFGSATTNTGSSFGTTGFGSTTTPGVFGAPAPTAFGATASAPTFGGFGATAPASGGLFGATAPAPSAFGAPSTTFGSPAPAPAMFGSPAPAPGGIFSSTAAAPGGGTRMAPFSITTLQDGSSNTNISFQSISAMNQYEAKSFEELRSEDYTLGNHGDGSATSGVPATGAFGFGGAPAPSTFGAPAPSSGGLFGSTAPAPATFGSPAPAPFGGFGGTTAPAPAPFGGFGAPAPAPFGAVKPGGLFGAPSPAPSGGLFGTTAPAPSGGLFGTSAPAPAFGTPAPAPGSLFGSAPASSGLFGAPAPAPSGGLFGAPAPSPSGGLFGAPTPAPSGGLFGGSAFGAPAPAPSGGLFGSAPAPSGLFGAPAPAGGLFGAHAPAPPGGLFGAPAAAPAAPTPGFGSPLGSAATIIPPSIDASLQQRLAAIQNQQKELEKLDVWRSKSPSRASVVPASLSESSAVLKVSPYSDSKLSTYRASPKSSAMIRPRGFGTTPKKAPPAIGASFGNLATPMKSPASIAASSAKRLTIKPEALTPKPNIRLRLTNSTGTDRSSEPKPGLNGGTPAPPIINGDIHAQRQTAPTPSAPATTPKTPMSITMKEGAPTGSGKKTKTPEDSMLAHYNQIVGSPSPATPVVHQTNGNYAPKLTKPGYITTPPLALIATMTEAQLAALAGFSVTRPAYGSVEWEGAVDVRGVDLDSVVAIEHSDVAVYDEEEKANTKPPVGEKLNRPAIITLENTFPPKEGANASVEAKQKFAERLEKTTARMNAEFISYDDANGIWIFRVRHFSRYGLSAYDSEEDESAPPPKRDVISQQHDQNFETGERGGRSPTRFTVPEEDDDVDMIDKDKGDEDVILVNDAQVDTISEIQKSAREAYKVMFLFPPLASIESVVADHKEEEDVFMDEATHVAPPALPIVAAPTEEQVVFPGDNGICSRMMAQSCISRSTVDHGMRMRRSFRVGWRPDGSFLHLKWGSTLAQSRAQFSPSSEDARAHLLKIHSEYAERNKENGSFILSNCSSDSLSATVRRIVETGDENETLYQAFALILCLLSTMTNGSSDSSLLVPTTNDSLMILLKKTQSMEAFRRWLTIACSQREKDVEKAQLRGDVYRAVFSAISAGDPVRASTVAAEAGLLQLAAMITAGSSCSESINEQVRFWRAKGASPLFPPALLRIYTVLGGDFSEEEKYFKDGDASCDWMKRMCLLLNYGTKEDGSDYDFATLVRKYNKDVCIGVAPKPYPHYMAGGTASEARSLLFGLICLCDAIVGGKNDLNVSLWEVIQPVGYTTSVHDFSGAFLVSSILSSLRCCVPLSDLEQGRLLSGYAGQLICAGKWEYAVYVMMCSVGDTSFTEWRKKRAKEIILQNFLPGGKQERFLKETLCIPAAWFEEGLADRAASRGDIFGFVQHMGNVSRHRVLEVLEEEIVPTLLFRNPRDTSALLDLLRPFSDAYDSLCSIAMQLHTLAQEIEELSLEEDSPQKSGKIDELCSRATFIEKALTAYKSSVHSLPPPSVCRISGSVIVDKQYAISEFISGIAFLKLQLNAMHTVGSIWDEGAENAPKKLPSQLPATNDATTLVGFV